MDLLYEIIDKVYNEEIENIEEKLYEYILETNFIKVEEKTNLKFVIQELVTIIKYAKENKIGQRNLYLILQYHMLNAIKKEEEEKEEEDDVDTRTVQ